MSITCVYSGGSLAVYLNGSHLDLLIQEGKVDTFLSLHGESIGQGWYTLAADDEARSVLRDIVDLDRKVREEQRTLVPNSTPGYSNRKIRKGKGHGKG